LTLGQFLTARALERAQEELRGQWTPLHFTVDCVYLIARSPDSDDRFVAVHAVPLGQRAAAGASVPGVVEGASVERLWAAWMAPVAATCSDDGGGGASAALSVSDRKVMARVVAWLGERLVEGNAPRSSAALARAVAGLCTVRTMPLSVDAAYAALRSEGWLTEEPDGTVHYASQPPSLPRHALVPGNGLAHDEAAVAALAQCRAWLATASARGASATRPRRASGLRRTLAQMAAVKALVQPHDVLRWLELALVLRSERDGSVAYLASA